MSPGSSDTIANASSQPPPPPSGEAKSIKGAVFFQDVNESPTIEGDGHKSAGLEQYVQERRNRKGKTGSKHGKETNEGARKRKSKENSQWSNEETDSGIDASRRHRKKRKISSRTTVRSKGAVCNPFIDHVSNCILILLRVCITFRRAQTISAGQAQGFPRQPERHQIQTQTEREKPPSRQVGYAVTSDSM